MVFDPLTGEFRYASAGHSTAFVRRDGRSSSSSVTGPVVGLEREGRFGPAASPCGPGIPCWSRPTASPSRATPRAPSSATRGGGDLRRRPRRPAGAVRGVVAEIERRSDGTVADDLAILAFTVVDDAAEGSWVVFPTMEAGAESQSRGSCSPAGSSLPRYQERARRQRREFVDLADARSRRMARRYENEADELVFLDITATVEGRRATLAVVWGGCRRADDSVCRRRRREDGRRRERPAARGLRQGQRELGELRDPADRRCLPPVRRPVHRGRHRRAPAPPRRRFEVVVDGGRTPTGRDAVAWARSRAARRANCW